MGQLQKVTRTEHPRHLAMEKKLAGEVLDTSIANQDVALRPPLHPRMPPVMLVGSPDLFSPGLWLSQVVDPILRREQGGWRKAPSNLHTKTEEDRTGPDRSI